MKKLLLFIVFNISLAVAFAQQSYWQQQTDYSIHVALNDVEHSLTGFIKIHYTNHSPDTLHYIWFHVWPNAYKNDKTAFSEQMLENGNTKFYFSSPQQKGFINQLDFRVNEVRADIEDHPEHLDIIKVILPSPLLPEEQIVITTPFHVKLPDNFSRGGHAGQSYQVTQWFPKPAVYDKKGWHAMPYLEQGEFYSELGNFEVAITVPRNYAVAATGELQNDEEKQWFKTRSSFTWKAIKHRKKTKSGSYKTFKQIFPISDSATKTLLYKQNNVHDFAWFADKRFIVNYDTCALESGKIIDVYSFYTPTSESEWTKTMEYTKKAVRFYSKSLGEYPFHSVNIVEGPPEMSGGMEYPTIAVIATEKDEVIMERIIAHELGHNWFYGILASNERNFPWMDEGMNSYYENRYTDTEKKAGTSWFNAGALDRIAFESVAAVKKDQAIDLPAPAFTPYNYYLSPYVKAAQWMELLETAVGKNRFDSCMQFYYKQWQFKHPYPEDFKSVVTRVSGKNTDSIFNLLHTTGSLFKPSSKKISLTWMAKADPENKYHNVGIAPALGFNYYDKLMLGGIIHNYNLPFTKFQFIAVPLYAFGSKQFNGIGRATYSWFPEKSFQKIEAGVSAARFSDNAYTDSSNHTTNLNFSKISPHIRFIFRNPNPRSQLNRFVQLKTYFINTDALRFTWDSVAMKNTHSVNTNTTTIGQLRYVTDNGRVLYPYRYELQFEASKDFGRITCTGSYFFNYPKGGGLNVRWFGGKFFYMGDNSSRKKFETDQYHLNMTAAKGHEDYTYSNYFIGRNEYSGVLSQQVMTRDGGFKVRTDLLSNKIGKTDNWLATLNFTSSIHPKIPVKLFLDIGTYSEGWDNQSEAPKLLYDAGFQLSLLRNTINIYIPVLYSEIYSDYFKSTPGNNFWQRISFSIDIQNINYKKISPLIPF